MKWGKSQLPNPPEGRDLNSWSALYLWYPHPENTHWMDERVWSVILSPFVFLFLSVFLCLPVFPVLFLSLSSSKVEVPEHEFT